MERRRWQKVLTLGALGLGLGMTPVRAQAQSGVGSQTTTSTGVGMLNPYTNPMMNPFLNPYMAASGQTAVGNPALYFMAAQQMNGGIGSGRLGGPNAGMKPAAKDKTAESRREGTANSPGAGASRYFNRATPTNLSASTGRYYNRQTKHFPSIAR